MKVLAFNSMDLDGGAALATFRTHRALREAGVDSTLVVQKKTSSDPNVLGPDSPMQRLAALARPSIDQLPLRPYAGRSAGLFTPAALPDRTAALVRKLAPDIVHLFWTAAGFLRPESLRAYRRPVVWTLHDMWPFTGGCHYDAGCGKFRQQCGQCPVLASDRAQDLSRSVWSRKSHAWKDVNLTVVATSQWIGSCARESSLFQGRRVEVIPNCLDHSTYKPLAREQARRIFNLPQDKTLVMISAMNALSDERKGFRHLADALANLRASGRAADLELVVLGASSASMPELGVPTHCIGTLRDEVSQAVLYSAANVLVAPSTQENLSNTVLEAMSCGVPVVAFDVGGMPDMIGHGSSGYLARPFDAADLARGILWAVSDADRSAAASSAARQASLGGFSASAVATRYVDLYRSLLT